MSPLVCCCKASQGCWSSHAENDGVPTKQRPINGPWAVSRALGTDLSHENETSVLRVTCPKSVIGVTWHGSYTSLALLFLANLQCLSWSGGRSSLPIEFSLHKICWLLWIKVFWVFLGFFLHYLSAKLAFQNALFAFHTMKTMKTVVLVEGCKGNDFLQWLLTCACHTCVI